MFNPSNTHGIYWTDRLSKEDRDESNPSRRHFHPFKYRWQARRHGKFAKSGTSTVYCTSELVFRQLITAWNVLGKPRRAMAEGLTWHYRALDPQPQEGGA